MERVFIASDHAGVELKTKLIQHLLIIGYSATDLGPTTTESVDYPTYAHELCEHIEDGAFGILICGTGIGMSMAANRHPHIRCAVATSIEMAMLTRQHNNANVLALGARLIDEPTAFAIVDMFLTTLYEGGRHDNRLVKLDPNGRPAKLAKTLGVLRSQELEARIHTLENAIRKARNVCGSGVMNCLGAREIRDGFDALFPNEPREQTGARGAAKKISQA